MFCHVVVYLDMQIVLVLPAENSTAVSFSETNPTVVYLLGILIQYIYTSYYENCWLCVQWIIQTNQDIWKHVCLTFLSCFRVVRHRKENSRNIISTPGEINQIHLCGSIKHEVSKIYFCNTGLYNLCLFAMTEECIFVYVLLYNFASILLSFSFIWF